MYSSIRRYTTSADDAAAIIDLIKKGNIEERIRQPFVVVCFLHG